MESKRPTAKIAGIEITHGDRPLWPGITKQDLAEYWQSVAGWALPGIALRPLAILRCPEGVPGATFFQKHGHGHLPAPVREGTALAQPYLAIDGLPGLIAMAQVAAIELHPWGATEADPAHPDRLVFDLDPGEGVAWEAVIQAAQAVKDRLEQLGLRSFCRTTGGKGLHVVAPLAPSAGWDHARRFCRTFAEAMEVERPERYVAHVKIADRRGRILVDWLRNAAGATAVASFSPRARPGATVATPLSWAEVTAELRPAAFTVRTVPARLAGLKADPWEGFARLRQVLPG